jgi:hypothetical protein
MLSWRSSPSSGAGALCQLIDHRMSAGAGNARDAPRLTWPLSSRVSVANATAGARAHDPASRRPMRVERDDVAIM